MLCILAPIQLRQWGQRFLAKRTLLHGAFFLIIVIVAWQSRTVLGVDRRSLLYTLLSGEEVTEGPLDPAAYAQVSGPGIGGARLAAIDVGATNFDPITFEDPEVSFSETLGGTAVVAPLQPLAAEPGSDGGHTTRHQSVIHTIQSGETVASIAADYNVSENTVLWANGLSSHTILKIGDHLTILPITGVLHTVSSGDTIVGLAHKYDASAKEIVEYNGLEDSSKLSLGQKLIIPDGAISAVTAPRIVGRDDETGRLEPAPEGISSDGFGFLWPTASRHVSQAFKWGHTGIDIDNRSRPSVYVAAAGTVEFAGWLGGYGNLIIVNHGSGLSTYYAHLDKFYASKGSAVAKGDAIGKMGSTGRSSGPHLHFEVRKNGRPTNPLAMYE